MEEFDFSRKRLNVTVIKTQPQFLHLQVKKKDLALGF